MRRRACRVIFRRCPPRSRSARLRRPLGRRPRRRSAHPWRRTARPARRGRPRAASNTLRASPREHEEAGDHDHGARDDRRDHPGHPEPSSIGAERPDLRRRLEARGPEPEPLPRHRGRQYLSRRGARSFAQSGPSADRCERRRAHPESASIKVNANGMSTNEPLCVSVGGGVVLSVGGGVVAVGGGGVVSGGGGGADEGRGGVVCWGGGGVVSGGGGGVVSGGGGVVVSLGGGVVVLGGGGVVVSLGGGVVVSLGGGVVVSVGWVVVVSVEGVGDGSGRIALSSMITPKSARRRAWVSTGSCGQN